MATMPYQEVRENGGFVNGSGRAVEEGMAAKEPWYNLTNGYLKAQSEAEYRASRAEPIALPGYSKLETSRVRNKLNLWRHESIVSLHLIEYYMNSVCPPLLFFTQPQVFFYCLPFSFYCVDTILLLLLSLPSTSIT